MEKVLVRKYRRSGCEKSDKLRNKNRLRLTPVIFSLRFFHSTTTITSSSSTAIPLVNPPLPLWYRAHDRSTYATSIDRCFAPPNTGRGFLTVFSETPWITRSRSGRYFIVFFAFFYRVRTRFVVVPTCLLSVIVIKFRTVRGRRLFYVRTNRIDFVVYITRGAIYRVNSPCVCVCVCAYKYIVYLCLREKALFFLFYVHRVVVE